MVLGSAGLILMWKKKKEAPAPQILLLKGHGDIQNSPLWSMDKGGWRGGRGGVTPIKPRLQPFAETDKKNKNATYLTRRDNSNTLAWGLIIPVFFTRTAASAKLPCWYSSKYRLRSPLETLRLPSRPHCSVK